MKRYHVITMLLLLLLVSCIENKEANALFATVDSLLEERPDSALSMLNRAYNNKGEWRKSQQMRYELLRAKAQNKAYVDFTTDSIMKEVAEYYDNHGTANEQMEAHYLLGCTYRDMGESPMALSCYLDATEKADTLSDDCDYGTLMRIWGQVADEFDRQGMPYKEMEANEKFKIMAIKCKDTINYINGISLGKRAFILLNDTTSAIKCMDTAFKLFMQMNLPNFAAKVIYPSIPYYINERELLKADSLIKFVEKELATSEAALVNNDIYFYNIKASYFEYINKLDSAEFFYRKLLGSNDIAAYSGLLSVYNTKGLSDSVYKYSKLKDIYIDKTYSRIHTQAMFNADGMFDYSRNQKIAMEKEKDAELFRAYLINVILIGGLIFIIVSILFVQYINKKRNELQNLLVRYEKSENDYQKAKEDFCLMEKDFDAYRIKKDVELSFLINKNLVNEAEIKKAKEEYKLMQTNYSEYKAKKDEEIKQLKKSRDNSSFLYEKKHIDVLLADIQNNDVVNRIKNHETIMLGYNVKITKKDWNSLFNLFKTKLPTLYLKCISNPKLNERERQVLVLVLLNIPSNTVSTLLGISPSHVSNIKTIVNDKLFLEASAKTLFRNIKTHYYGI